MLHNLRIKTSPSIWLALGIPTLHGICAVTLSTQSGTAHQTSAIASTANWMNSSTSSTTAMSSSSNDCPYSCIMQGGVLQYIWYPEVFTQVVAIKTVVVEISDGHRFTTISVNSQNFSSPVVNPTLLYGGQQPGHINDTTIVLDGVGTMSVLQTRKWMIWITLMRRLTLAHGR